MQNLSFLRFCSDLNSMTNFVEGRSHFTTDLAHRWLERSKAPFNYMDRLVTIVRENSDVPLGDDLRKLVTKTKKLIGYFSNIPPQFKSNLLSFLWEKEPAELEFFATTLCEEEEDRFAIWNQIKDLDDPSTEDILSDSSSEDEDFPLKPGISRADQAIRRIKNLNLSQEHTSEIVLNMVTEIGKMDPLDRSFILGDFWSSPYSLRELFENTTEECRFFSAKILAIVDPKKTLAHIDDFQIQEMGNRLVLARELLKKNPSFFQKIEETFHLDATLLNALKLTNFWKGLKPQLELGRGIK